MSTISVHVKYRPLRIGWCVRNGNLDDLRKAFKLTHTLWGGRHNPIIPVDSLVFAKQLVGVFRVDALYPVADDGEIRRFVEQFPYLMWPMFDKELFIDDSYSGKLATVLDLYHPVLSIYEEHIKNVPSPKICGTIFRWSPEDPLADVFLAAFGGFPSKEETPLDYDKFIAKYLAGREIVLEVSKPLPTDAHKCLTANVITAYALLRDRNPGWYGPGFYVGNSKDSTDLLNFWNLRAADLDLLFFDPGHATRLEPLREAYLKELRGRPRGSAKWEDFIIWAKSRDTEVDVSPFGANVVRCGAEPTIWNGLNVKPPVMHFEAKYVLGSVTDEGETPSISFQLPDKPFFDDFRLHTQHAVVSVQPLVAVPKREDITFRTPFIPELNEYYGREAHFIWNAARAEMGGLGIVTEVTSDHLTIRALKVRNLITKIFETFGMKAEPSQPGLIAAQLIQQLGGIQGCRAFKIAGVRKLIGQYSPYQSFTKSAAVQIIGQNDPITGRPNFTAYEDLHIAFRPSGKLKPEDAFTYLVEKGVFRVGLKFECPSCQLEFWRSIDDVKTFVKCEYCGNEFNISPHLRDRDWAYRRSGLFGHENHQEGAIPVVVTLQQLDTILHMGSMVFTPALNITSLTAPVNPCETAFVLITRGFEGRVQLAIGECKTRKEITTQDVENLKRIADAFPHERFDVYIIFSKLTAFTPEETTRCRAAQHPYRHRVILLSPRELEPYFVYERTAAEFDINRTAVSLEDLANATPHIYFDPKVKTTNAAEREGT